MFCAQCGQKNSDAASFCVSCGQKLQVAISPAPQPQMQQAPPVQSNQQPVAHDVATWVCQMSRKLSMFKSMSCYVVFKRDHLVLVHVSSDMIKTENARLQNEIKDQGLGFFKGSSAMMLGWAAYGEKYKSMPTQDMLAENPENRAFAYADMTGVLFHAYSTSIVSDDGTTSATGGKFNISLQNGETIKLTHQIAGRRDLKQLLLNVFGNRLKYRN